MKKLRLLPLLLAFLCLSATAFAAGIPGQQPIAFISDANGYVTTLTDDDATSAWTRTKKGEVDLTLNLNGGSVGEIWIRNGYAYTQNWYNHYDRVGSVKVTVYYGASQYIASYDSYRYQLEDAFRPNTHTKDWNGGYQRLLLPKQYKSVTKIELTIESVVNGAGATGVTISDIIVASGNHATATPRSYATATPRPYTVYITPTPAPGSDKDDYVEFITPIPDDYVELITPIPDDSTELITPIPDDDVELLTPPPAPTEPLVELITPAPTREPIEYPSAGGIPALLAKRMATRSGPGTRFDEPGSFFSEGDEVNVISRVYDPDGGIHWLQVEFKYDGRWYRAYTPSNRVNIDRSLVPQEAAINAPVDTRKILSSVRVSFGPGNEYATYNLSMLHEGNNVDVYAIENGWAQIEYTDFGSYEDPQPRRRGWVPLSVLYAE